MNRRVIWLLFAVVFAVSCFFPPSFYPVKVSDSVRDFYEGIEALPPGSPVLVSMDFIPAFTPELRPMALAVCRHAFRKNLRVVAMTLRDTGAGLAYDIVGQAAAESGKKYGEDFVFLGWQPDDVSVITGMGVGIYSMFPVDYAGSPVAAMKVMKGISSLRDFGFMAQIGAGFMGMPEWVSYGSDKYNIKIGIGCTAGAETTLRPYYDTGQISGLVPAIKGAAEYEKLAGMKGDAVSGLNAISLAQVAVVLSIIIANAVWALNPKKWI